jgi:hypothetical protein
MSQRPVRHALRLLALGIVVGTAMYAGYLALGML